jgi:hypothetical protein
VRVFLYIYVWCLYVCTYVLCIYLWMWVCIFVHMYVNCYALFAITLYPHYVIPPVQSTPCPQHNMKPLTTLFGKFKATLHIVTASLSFCRWQHICLKTGVTMDKTARCHNPQYHCTHNFRPPPLLSRHRFIIQGVLNCWYLTVMY